MISAARVASMSLTSEQVVEKGNVRNTVLRQIKTLRKSRDLLNQGREIKEKEIDEYKDRKPDKAKGIQDQVGIIESGLKHIEEAIKELEKYKDTSVTY